MIPCVVACAILIFCTFAVQNIAGTMVFATLYGFFFGACSSTTVLRSSVSKIPSLDIGLLAPMLASLAKTDAEIGARMGICFTFTGLFIHLGTSRRIHLVQVLEGSLVRMHHP